MESSHLYVLHSIPLSQLMTFTTPSKTIKSRIWIVGHSNEVIILLSVSSSRDIKTNSNASLIANQSINQSFNQYQLINWTKLCIDFLNNQLINRSIDYNQIINQSISQSKARTIVSDEDFPSKDVESWCGDVSSVQLCYLKLPFHRHDDDGKNTCVYTVTYQK